MLWWAIGALPDRAKQDYRAVERRLSGQGFAFDMTIVADDWQAALWFWRFHLPLSVIACALNLMRSSRRSGR